MIKSSGGSQETSDYGEDLEVAASSKVEGSITSEESINTREMRQELEKIKNQREEREKQLEAAKLETEMIHREKEELERRAQETEHRAKVKRRRSIEQEKLAAEAAVEHNDLDISTKQDERITSRSEGNNDVADNVVSIHREKVVNEKTETREEKTCCLLL